MTSSAVSRAVPGVLASAWRSPWVSFVTRRLGRLVVSLWVLITASFLMIHLIPGDPIRAALGVTAPVELVAERRKALGLDDPVLTQYVHYLQGLFRGDMGVSMTTELPVSQLIADRLPATVALAVLAFVLVMVISVPLGAVMGVVTRGGRRRGGELAFTSTSVIFAAIPEFLLAVAMVYLFAVRLGWLPVAGREGASSYILPVVALSLAPIAILVRIVRLEMLSTLDNDFIRTARAKRLPARIIYARHALPNALTATLTLAGMLLTGLIAGTVLVEEVFAWSGLGSTIVQSIMAKDYPVVQGIVLVYGVMVLFVNLVVDLILALLDPRSTIRES